jgi:hypothetical protein
LSRAARGAVSTDKDQRIEQVGMIEPEHQRDMRADTAAGADRLLDVTVAHDPDDVFGHVLQGERRRRFHRAAVAADVDRDDLEPGGKMRRLVDPEVVVERIGVDENQRRPFAAALVPDG